MLCYPLLPRNLLERLVRGNRDMQLFVLKQTQECGATKTQNGRLDFKLRLQIHSLPVVG